jgi:hypothetical protein
MMSEIGQAALGGAPVSIFSVEFGKDLRSEEKALTWLR